jgi:hypothetical protein
MVEGLIQFIRAKILSKLAWLGLIPALLAVGCHRAAAPMATVSVNATQPGSQIPRNFVGFSLEVSEGGQGLQAFKSGSAPSQSGGETQYALGRPGAPNDGFFQFMRNLGPGILRLGGNSQDNTCWDPGRAPHPKLCQAALAAGDMQIFSNAAEGSGWQLILGINLKQNSGACALREVTQGIAPNIQPGQIFGFEIGNEPDLFRRGARPSSYTPQEHVKEFLGYVRAFRANRIAHGYAFVGPATCCAWRNARDLGVFVDGVGAKNLKLVTIHDYPTTTCGGRTVTVAQLLAPALIERFNSMAKPLVAAASTRHLPIALAETNSASCGGMPGVSNAFASTAWGLDWMFSAAEDGLRTVNFHISFRPGGSSYNAVDTVGSVDAAGHWSYRNVAEPLYYAMYLFAQNASGARLLPVAINTSANVRAFAASACPDCPVNVFLINKDLGAAGQVHVHVTGKTGPASLVLVRAPSLSSGASAVRYGGVVFDSQGRLPAPHTVSVHADSKGDYVFTLPNASVALLKVSRGH